jgi:hypothetical protein
VSKGSVGMCWACDGFYNVSGYRAIDRVTGCGGRGERRRITKGMAV